VPGVLIPALKGLSGTRSEENREIQR